MKVLLLLLFLVFSIPLLLLVPLFLFKYKREDQEKLMEKIQIKAFEFLNKGNLALLRTHLASTSPRQGQVEGVPLGRVHVEDPDDWDARHKTWEWRRNVPHPLFTLDPSDGSLSLSPHASDGS